MAPDHRTRGPAVDAFGRGIGGHDHAELVQDHGSVRRFVHDLGQSGLARLQLERALAHATCHIRDGTWLTDEIAKESGLDLAADAFAKELWLTTHQSFTLSEDIAKWKFGPHYVKCRTPFSNIRLTTFFAAEHEVRIIDPDRVEFIECVGCQLREISPDDGVGASANTREQT